VDARSAAPAGLPEPLGGIACGSGKDEQQVGESVEVADDLGVYALDGDRRALNAAADCAAYVQLSARRGAPGEQEGLEWFETLLARRTLPPAGPRSRA
jgi:hypothetical protein